MDRAALAAGDRDRGQPRREMARRVLEEVTIAPHAVREDLQGERASAHERDHRGGDPGVVASEVELREPDRREHHAVGVGDRDPP